MPDGEQASNFATCTQGKLVSGFHVSPLTEELAERFYSLVIGSGVILWAGMLWGTDEYRRPLIDMYLLEQTARPKRKLRNDASVADVSDAWERLAFSVEPNYVACLHLINANQYSAKQLEDQLRRFCAKTGRLEMVWAESIGSKKKIKAVVSA